MRRTRNMLMITVLIVVFACAWLARIASQPPAGRPNVSITFLDYTNDFNSGRLARFAVSNHSTAAISRAGMVQIQTATGWTGCCSSGYAILNAGEQSASSLAQRSAGL